MSHPAEVPCVDIEGVRRLLAYVHDAIDQQPPRVADQLRAAMREGRTSFRVEPSALAPVAVVTVDGYELAEVDVRNLLEDPQ